MLSFVFVMLSIRLMGWPVIDWSGPCECIMGMQNPRAKHVVCPFVSNVESFVIFVVGSLKVI